MRRLVGPVTLPVTLLLLVACTAAPGPTPSLTERLDGRAFLSTSVTEGGGPRDLVPGTRIRISFSAGNLGARAGCNALGGAFRLDGGRLVVDSLSTTDMGCDQPLMDQDTWLARFLTAGPALVLAGNDLTLAGGGTTIVLLDRRIADPDRPLVGTVWRVEALMAGQATESLPSDAPARLTFGADGRLAIETGCNTGEAAFVVDGGSISITGIGLTKKACPGPHAEQETAIVSVLRADRLAVTIEASSLILSAGERGLGLRVE
jgi:heat shock protein HslJ